MDHKHPRYRTTSTPTPDGLWYEKRLASLDDWEQLKTLMAPLQHDHAVPRHRFPEPHVMQVQTIQDAAHWLDADHTHLPAWQLQLVQYVRRINRAGIAHRDLHIDNLLFRGPLLFVIDHEWAAWDDAPLWLCHDITGQGTCGPNPLSGINLFYHPHGQTTAHLMGLQKLDFYSDLIRTAL